MAAGGGYKPAGLGLDCCLQVTKLLHVEPTSPGPRLPVPGPGQIISVLRTTYKEPTRGKIHTDSDRNSNIQIVYHYNDGFIIIIIIIEVFNISVIKISTIYWSLV